MKIEQVRRLRIACHIPVHEMAARCKIKLSRYIDLESGEFFVYPHEEDAINKAWNEIASARAKVARWNASALPASEQEGGAE